MQKYKNWILIFCFSTGLNYCIAQDSLTVEMVQAISYSFSLENGRLQGEGADFLKREIAKAQITMLGDYLNSKNTSNFTTALIAELNAANYKTMALGIGPVSGKIIQTYSKKPNTVINNLRALNNKYSFQEKEKVYTPIPDIKYLEDAQFIEKASQLEWSIIGFGNETWNGLIMLIDEMYANFSSKNQKDNNNLYKTCLANLQHYYKTRNGDLHKFSMEVKKDKSINEFLNLALKERANALIVEAFKKSIHRCWMHANRMFFEKNELRIKNEKKLLKQQLECLSFDIQKDKLFVKWDINFLSKGFQPYAFYGLGNMLNEIANYNGNTSINIGVMRRYYLEDDQVKDELKGKNIVSKRLKRLLQIGEKDKWKVIDLRPLIKGYYYWPAKYLLNPWVEDLIKRYDLIVIPATDAKPSPNYD